MDGDRFDALIRSLAVPRSRRGVLKTLAAGASGGVLATVGAGRASAKGGRITLCHQPGTAAEQSLTVDASALSAHLSHGDYLNPSGCCGSGVAVCLDGAGNGTCCPTPSRCLGGICCTPLTCADVGANCGTVDDGCGGSIDCGACFEPESCGGGGIANVCGCTPTDCAALGASCGTISDGCGSALDCGSCDADSCLVCGDDLTCASTCSGGSVCCGGGVCGLASGAAGCTADGDCCSGICVGGICQAAPGGEGSACDSEADCASGVPCIDGICCSSGLVCGGACCADSSQVCFESVCCAPKTCADQSANCGTITDTCGSPLECGTCTSPQTCGGGGTDNVCGCTKTTCAAHGKNCGSIPDDCGNFVLCGLCGDGEECIDNVCQAECIELGIYCGSEPGACCPGTSCDKVYPVHGNEGGWPVACCRGVKESCPGGDQDCCMLPAPTASNPDDLIDTLCIAGVCCVPQGFHCRTVSDCCGGAGFQCIHNPEPTCGSPADYLTCCAPSGAPCGPYGAADCECCSGSCVSGVCA